MNQAECFNPYFQFIISDDEQKYLVSAEFTKNNIVIRYKSCLYNINTYDEGSLKHNLEKILTRGHQIRFNNNHHTRKATPPPPTNFDHIAEAISDGIEQIPFYHIWKVMVN